MSENKFQVPSQFSRCPGVWQQMFPCISLQQHPWLLEQHLDMLHEKGHLKGDEATSNGNSKFTSSLGKPSSKPKTAGKTSSLKSLQKEVIFWEVNQSSSGHPYPSTLVSANNPLKPSPPTPFESVTAAVVFAQVIGPGCPPHSGPPQESPPEKPAHATRSARWTVCRGLMRAVARCGNGADGAIAKP